MIGPRARRLKCMIEPASLVVADRLLSSASSCLQPRQAYLQPDSPTYAGVEAALEATARLLQLARRKGVLVIHTNVEFLPGGLNGGGLA